MKYRNAAEILPDDLLKELQAYISGDILYIPQAVPKKQWGMDSGSRNYYCKRNSEIKRLFASGTPIHKLSKQYGLADSTIKKIIYQ